MSAQDFAQRVESSRNGTNPAVICKVPSGWVVLCDMQFLRGYCVLQADPLVESINALDETSRKQFLLDMAIIGDALMEVTGAYRINYAVLGNTDPFLHAHIVPRYSDESDDLIHGLPWSYPREMIDRNLFDPQHDQNLMKQIATSIKKRLNLQ